MLWTNFVGMDREAFIETQDQSLTEHEETTKYSVAKEYGENEDEKQFE